MAKTHDSNHDHSIQISIKTFSYRRPICNKSKMKSLLEANQTAEKGFRLQVLQHQNHSKSSLKVAICASLLLDTHYLKGR